MPKDFVSLADWSADELRGMLVETTRKTADAAEAEIDRRQRAEQADIGWCERLIVAGYRDLAKRHHPDHGGDLKSMQEINAAVEVLREMVR